MTLALLSILCILIHILIISSFGLLVWLGVLLAAVCVFAALVWEGSHIVAGGLIMLYSVHILNENGHGSYLEVKGKSSWKTKTTAVKHAKDIISIKNKSGRFKGMLEVSVEDELGHTIESFRSE